MPNTIGPLGESHPEQEPHERLQGCDPGAQKLEVARDNRLGQGKETLGCQGGLLERACIIACCEKASLPYISLTDGKIGVRSAMHGTDWPMLTAKWTTRPIPLELKINEVTEEGRKKWE